MLLAASHLDSVAAWLTVGALAIAAYVFWRGGGGTAIQSLQAANQVLERRVHELEEQARRDASEIATLRARTDLATQIAPIVEWTVNHERRGQERFERTLLVLERIADRLGKEEDLHGD